jgi:hypothetical protein
VAKLGHIAALLRQYPTLRIVNVWDDRLYQLQAFGDWLRQRRSRRQLARFQLFHVRTIRSSPVCVCMSVCLCVCLFVCLCACVYVGRSVGL